MENSYIDYSHKSIQMKNITKVILKRIDNQVLGGDSNA